MADDITPEAFDPTALTDAELSAEFARVAERMHAAGWSTAWHALSGLMDF